MRTIFASLARANGLFHVQNIRDFRQTKFDSEINFRYLLKQSNKEHIWRGKKFDSSQLGVFGPRRGLQANHGTVRKRAIFPQPSNQKQLKWSNTVYVNKWSFASKIKLCFFQVTKTWFCIKVIRIFNPQPVRIPHFKSQVTRKQARWSPFLLHFLIFISGMLITPSFKKS